ncbi:integral membrane efflux protein [Streptomyces zinciresistens K42]|uniref:Integral membrane efflux protein n=1 Tax=Streptomyces zinciresistens K42 TaxID=700597 RepID=G2GIL4_9ACTN|nr:MFS transporter [Streptomyces zinciresistens]EGX56649.1 integral membrane efflux protein [Streptomyces zinciresistens K42]
MQPTPVRRWLGLVCLTTALLIIGLDVTVLTIALPTLATAVGATTSELLWITNAFTLPFAALLLPATALGTRGRKHLLMAGLTLFAAGSAAALPADSASGLIVSRALMGAGAAAAVPHALSLAPGLVSPADRDTAAAVASAGFALGLPLGPVAGGWLLAASGWHAIFVLNLVVILAALAGVALAVPEPRRRRPEPVDAVCAVLALTGTSSVAYAVTEATTRGWHHPATLPVLLAGTALLGAMVVRLIRTRSPLADAALWRHPRFTWAICTLSFITLVLLALLFMIPQYLQQVQGYDALATGLRLMPMMAGLALGTIAGDRLANVVDAKWTLVLGLLLWSFGLLWIGRLGHGSSYPGAAGALLTTGLALGCTLPTALAVVTGSPPPEKAVTAHALANACRQIAAALGIAVLGGVLNTTYRRELREDAPAGLADGVVDEARQSIAGAAEAAAALPAREGEDLMALAHHAFVTGMTLTARIGASVTALLALLLVVYMPTVRHAASAAP